MICFSSGHDCWLFVFDIIRNMILFYCLIKRAILFEWFRFEVKFRVHEALNEHEIEIHIKVYIFIIIMNLESQLSLVSLFLVCWGARLSRNRKDKNVAWKGKGIISQRDGNIFFDVIMLHKFIRNAFIK